MLAFAGLPRRLAPLTVGCMAVRRFEMKPANSSVDVLIPVYNAEATLREALESILRQTLTDIRIIVVDDGSTDGSAAILEDLRCKDPRVQVLTKPNGGIVDALNFGLTQCSADYIARFDSDDVAFPDHLQNLRNYLDEHADCIAVGSAVEHMDEFGRPLYGLPHPGSPSDSNPRWAPALEPYLIHPFMMVRRSSLIEAGGYRYVFNSEDSDLYWRLSERGRLHNLQVVGGKYRVHGGSISSVSVLSGRIMAVSSQLAALSAMRRRLKLQDLQFGKQALMAYRTAATLEKICEVASMQLTPAEANHLRIAASMKLLELSAYRPFKLEESDYHFIRKSLVHRAKLSKKNRDEVRWYLSCAARKIAERDGWATAFGLIPTGPCLRGYVKAILARSSFGTHMLNFARRALRPSCDII